MAIYTESIIIDTPELFKVIGNQSQVDPVVAEQAIDQASLVIETITGVPFDVEVRESAVTSRDVHFIKQAVIWQAAFLLDQTDFLSRIAVNSISQDGQNIQANNELTFVLAPLAKRALANCSWSKSRTVGGRVPKRRGSFWDSDDHTGWQTIKG